MLSLYIHGISVQTAIHGYSANNSPCRHICWNCLQTFN